MLGLGETNGELLDVIRDLRGAGCDILTLGQYLRPSPEHIAVARYVPPAEFAELKTAALAMGFHHVESGPLVRSSYHAWEHVNDRRCQKSSAPRNLSPAARQSSNYV